MAKFSMKELMNASQPSEKESEITATEQAKYRMERTIDQITVEINFYKEQTVHNIIEIGKRLIEAKERLPHGEWTSWLRDGVDFSERTARNFIKVANEYSNRQLVADLSFTKLLALAQIPSEERDDFITQTHVVNGEEKTVADMTKRELERAVRERDQEKQRRQEAEVSAELERQKHNETLAKLKEAESRPVEVAIQQMSESEKEALRQEGAQEARKESARQMNQSRAQVAQIQYQMSDLQQKLDEAKSGQPSNVQFSAQEAEAAADTFADAVDAAYQSFQMVIGLCDAAAALDGLESGVAFLEEIAEKLNKMGAQLKNLSLANQEFDLPEDLL